MKRGKKSTRRKLVAELDRIWSLLVRAKYPRCIICGSQPTQAHHCIVRKAQSQGVRWILENGVGLCVGCHIFKLHGQQSDKVWLDKYITILNDLIPADVQQNIVDIGHGIAKYSTADLEGMIAEYKGKLGEME